MTKRKVIIDCDPGIDDSLALLYAILHPELDVVAITTVAGNVPLRLANDNALICLELAGRLDIPIYSGESKPIKPSYIPTDLPNGFDGLGEMTISHTSTATIQEQPATAFLAEYFEEPNDTSIIALGPLTNLSKALTFNPRFGENAHRIVTIACNQKDEPCINYLKDSFAADHIYENVKRPIEVIGRAFLPKIILTPNIRYYLRTLNNDIGLFINDMLEYSFDYHWKEFHTIGHFIQDSFAMRYFLTPTEDFTQHETHFNPIVESIDNIDFFEDFLSVVSLTDGEDIRPVLEQIILK